MASLLTDPDPVYSPEGLAKYLGSTGAANLAALPGLESMAGQVNAFNLAQKQGQLASGLPDYGALTGASSANILANLRGELPADVRNLLATSAAERAVGQGMPAGTFGSTMPNFDLLRTLGLTSLARKDVGEQQLSNAVARTPTVPIYSPTEQMITPAQAAQYDLQWKLANKWQPASINIGGGGVKSPAAGATATTPALQPTTTAAPTGLAASSPTFSTSQRPAMGMFSDPVNALMPGWLQNPTKAPGTFVDWYNQGQQPEQAPSLEDYLTGMSGGFASPTAFGYADMSNTGEWQMPDWLSSPATEATYAPQSYLPETDYFDSLAPELISMSVGIEDPYFGG